VITMNGMAWAGMLLRWSLTVAGLNGFKGLSVDVQNLSVSHYAWFAILSGILSCLYLYSLLYIMGSLVHVTCYHD
jgi:hypothetical protein